MAGLPLPVYLQYQRAWLRVLAGPGPAAACSLSDSTFTTVRRHTRHWAAQLIRPPHPQPTAARTDNSGFGNVSLNDGAINMLPSLHGAGQCWTVQSCVLPRYCVTACMWVRLAGPGPGVISPQSPQSPPCTPPPPPRPPPSWRCCAAG